MSIDEAIEHGKEQLEIFGGEHKEFIEISIDTMRKYQKIQEIIIRYDATWEFHHMKPTIDEIRKVIEDGNDD